MRISLKRTAGFIGSVLLAALLASCGGNIADNVEVASTGAAAQPGPTPESLRGDDPSSQIPPGVTPGPIPERTGPAPEIPTGLLAVGDQQHPCFDYDRNGIVDYGPSDPAGLVTAVREASNYWVVVDESMWQPDTRTVDLSSAEILVGSTKVQFDAPKIVHDTTASVPSLLAAGYKEVLVGVNVVSPDLAAISAQAVRANDKSWAPVFVCHYELSTFLAKTTYDVHAENRITLDQDSVNDFNMGMLGWQPSNGQPDGDEAVARQVLARLDTLGQAPPAVEPIPWSELPVRERALADAPVDYLEKLDLTAREVRIRIPQSWKTPDAGAICALGSEGWLGCVSLSFEWIGAPDDVDYLSFAIMHRADEQIEFVLTTPGAGFTDTKQTLVTLAVTAGDSSYLAFEISSDVSPQDVLVGRSIANVQVSD